MSNTGQTPLWNSIFAAKTMSASSAARQHKRLKSAQATADHIFDDSLVNDICAAPWRS